MHLPTRSLCCFARKRSRPCRPDGRHAQGPGSRGPRGPGGPTADASASIVLVRPEASRSPPPACVAQIPIAQCHMRLDGAGDCPETERRRPKRQYCTIKDTGIAQTSVGSKMLGRVHLAREMCKRRPERIRRFPILHQRGVALDHSAVSRKVLDVNAGPADPNRYDLALPEAFQAEDLDIDDRLGSRELVVVPQLPRVRRARTP